MKRNQWIGLLGGAALGAAAGYLLANRGMNLGRGLKNVAESAMDTLGIGEEEEHETNISRNRKTGTTSRRG